MSWPEAFVLAAIVLSGGWVLVTIVKAAERSVRQRNDLVCRIVERDPDKWTIR